MRKLIGLLQSRLSLKILVALTIGVAIVMVVVINLNVQRQRKEIRKRMTTFGKELKYLAYAGIKHPMSVGDSQSVKQQLFEVRESLKDAEIAICDFNQIIVFATHEDRINQQVSRLVLNSKALDALSYLLATGDPEYEGSFEESVDGEKYLVSIHMMPNEAECHHCHGTSRDVLGGMIVRQRTDATYAAIASLRNQTVIISVIGIGAIISIIYFLLSKLVTQPVTELARKAELFARGDMDVFVDVRTNDSIGVLGNSFNFMVASIKNQIEYANSLKVAIADPLFMVDTEMVITYMNQACANLTGYSREEAEGKLTCRSIFQSDLCETTCPVRKCFETRDSIEGVRITMTSRDGREIPLMASASALKDAHGNIIGGVEICRDITDVLEAERLRYIKQIAAREEEQRKALEAQAKNLLVILSLASDGNLKVRAEVTDKNEVMDEIAAHTNLMLENLEKLYGKISTFSKELELEVARRTMMLREKTLLLERANRELRELDRLKSSFLANMSHELRTPMNSIIGYTDLLIDGVDGAINTEQEKSLKKVGNNARHLLQLINDILDMSKIESGKIELDLRETNIKMLLETVASTLEAPIAQKGLTLEFAIDEHLPLLYVDEDKVRQIILNLLSNAIKFTHKGVITISAKPSQRGIRPGEAPLFVEICVADTGIGVKEEDIGKLFDKFSQIDVSTIRQYEGTGLGLSIARGLVVLHKGVIWAESEAGIGSQFYFTLPAQKKILEKPAEPIIETMMAEELAKYFAKPCDLFMKPPRYAGKSIKCWEYMHCGQTSCPAYGSKEHRCWLISGTHCKGMQIAACPEKVNFCRGCEIIENLVLEGFNSTGPEIIIAAKEQIKTVLAIDDNPEVIEIIQKSIGNDYKVIGLLSGEEAVEQAIALKPYAITLDIMMPRKNGWQVLQELKKTPATQDIPVIILSIVDEKKMGFGLGAAEYMVKPIDKNRLLYKLRKLEKLAIIKKVLIVDDDAGSVERIGSLLEYSGYRVATADTNQNAVHSIKVSRPDLIVMNLMMPDNNGFDLIEYIKSDKNAKKIPLILITRQDLSDEDLERLDGSIKATLNKGLLTEADLLDELKNTLEKL
ncbi:MAG: response regulator [Proteobacteria bacterium]|nr:response regulator [Pseudomonadota bacterium]MBU1709183.1 response regulator [Pseudomonadota bacterium]